VRRAQHACRRREPLQRHDEEQREKDQPGAHRQRIYHMGIGRFR
jgi:hypothetical protein